MEGQTSQNLETGRARARTQIYLCHKMSHFVPRYFLDVLVHLLTFTKSSSLGWFASLIFTCCCRSLFFFFFFFYVRKKTKKNKHIISEEKKRLGFGSFRIVSGAAEAGSRDNREGRRELNLRTDTPQNADFYCFYGDLLT